MTNTTNALMKSLEKSMALDTLEDMVRVERSSAVYLLCDCSLSMSWTMVNGKTRISGLREIVAGIQSKRQTPMIVFGPQQPDPTHELGWLERKVTWFATEIPDPTGGTPMAEAIDFARESKGGRLVVISDGAPNDPSAAMAAAKRFGGQIDVVYVGDPGDAGSVFLDELAKATGGSRFEGDLSQVKELTGAVIGLLNGEVLTQDDDDEEDDEDEDDDDEEDDDA